MRERYFSGAKAVIAVVKRKIVELRVALSHQVFTTLEEVAACRISSRDVSVLAELAEILIRDCIQPIECFGNVREHTWTITVLLWSSLVGRFALEVDQWLVLSLSMFKTQRHALGLFILIVSSDDLKILPLATL